MTIPLPFSFVHVQWYRFCRRKKYSLGSLKGRLAAIQTCKVKLKKLGLHTSDWSGKYRLFSQYFCNLLYINFVPVLSRWVSINYHCCRFTVSPHCKGTKKQPKPHMGARVTNWKDLSLSGWCPVWWWRVSKMIMNYQIPLKAKNEYATISFSRQKCTIWSVGSKVIIIPLHAWTGPFGSRRLRSQDF